MIGQLCGVVTLHGLSGACIVDVGGVGYEVTVPLGTLGLLPKPPEKAVLWVHTHVREDQLTLYGFASDDDRHAFRTLLGIANIGPKLAMAILSHLDAPALAQAVRAGDTGRLSGIPGVGKKTVERVVLELRDKLDALTGGAPRGTGAPLGSRPSTPAAPEGPLDQVARALIDMGYKPKEAERAIRGIEDGAGRPITELLRQALLNLA